MTETYVSIKQLAARYEVHPCTIWRWMNNERAFPKPKQLSPGCTRWKLSDVVAWEKTKGIA